MLVLALAAVAALGTFGLLRGWRLPATSDYYRPRPFWPWGEPAWYGFRRTELIGQLFIVALLLDALFPNLIVVWGIAGFFVLIPLGLTIFFFNWPRILVPPALREQPGFFAHLRRRWRT